MIWLKKNWKWILFPIAILLIVLAWLRNRQGPAPVPVPSDTGTAIALQDVRTEQQIEVAEQQAKEEIKKIEEQHAAAIQTFDAKQKETYEELKQGSPQALTDWLLEVGKGKK